MPVSTAVRNDRIIEERSAILTRLRELLVSQRQKFYDYLHLLDKEREVIEIGDVEKIEILINIEKNIVGEIQTLQKVIVPLEDLTEQTYPLDNSSIPVLKTDLEHLRTQILARSNENQALLRDKMTKVRQEIKNLRKPLSFRSANNSPGKPSIIDITS